MTDTINEARALLAYWRNTGWSEDGCNCRDCHASRTLAALVTELEAARAELSDLAGHFAKACAQRDSRTRQWEIAATSLAKATSDLERTRAELAAARAAMPTAEEYKRVADALEGELMEAPKARREWLAAGAAWLDRMHAYHAAHPAAPSDYDAESPETRARLDAACRPFGGDRQPVTMTVEELFGAAPDLPEPCAVCSEALCECGTGRAGGGGHE